MFSYYFSYASPSCDANYNGKAMDYLQGCSRTGTNVGIPADVAGIDKIKWLVKRVAEKVIAFGSLFAIGAIVFSGIQYTTSYGDDEKVKKAKTTGIYAIIGLLILLVSFSMVNIVVEFIYSIWTIGQ